MSYTVQFNDSQLKMTEEKTIARAKVFEQDGNDYFRTLRRATVEALKARRIAQRDYKVQEADRWERRLRKVPALKTVVYLSQWLQNIFSQRWLSVEDLAKTLSVDFAFFRSAEPSRDTDPNRPDFDVIRGQRIDLDIQLAVYPVALIVHFTPESDQKRNILLQVHPDGGQICLPPGVQLIVLDESGDTFLEAQSRKIDNYIQLEFTGEPGERFSVKVALGDTSVTEYFVI